MKIASFAEKALDLDMPTVAGDDSSAKRKAESGPLTWRLGGEKRIEYLSLLNQRDTAPIIRHRQYDPVSPVASGNSNQSPFGQPRRLDGLHRVDQQVDEHLADLFGNTGYPRHVCGMLGLDLDIIQRSGKGLETRELST